MIHIANLIMKHGDYNKYDIDTRKNIFLATMKFLESFQKKILKHLKARTLFTFTIDLKYCFLFHQ